MLQDIFDQRVRRIEDQGLALFGHLIHSEVHSVHGIHLHHVVHAAGLLVHGQHGGDICVLESLKLDFEFLIVQGLADDLLDLLAVFLCLLFVSGGLTVRAKGILDIRVDPGKMDSLVLCLQLGDKGLVDVVAQDKCLHVVFTEHTDILALLLGIGHVVDGAFLFLFLFVLRAFLCGICFGLVAVGNHLSLDLLAVLVLGRFRLGIFGVDLKSLGKRVILSVQILEEDVICHLLTELVVAQASVLDEGADVIPVLVVVLLVRLAHAGQLLRDLL